MEHTDPAMLAELALGEPSAEEAVRARQHVRECERCAAELEALERVVSAARDASPADAPVAPPAGVWEAVAAELGLGKGREEEAADAAPAARPGTEPRIPQPQPEPQPSESVAAGPVPRVRPAGRTRGTGHVPGPAGGPQQAPAAPLRLPAQARPPRTRRSALLLAAVALAVGAALGSSATWWATGRDTAVVAAGERSVLGPLAVKRAEGTAQVADREGGARLLRISVDGLPPTKGYFEVWLMDRSHTRLVSLGTLGPDGSAVLPLPDNVDFAEYTLVDVSDQPFNGSPEHSGRSVVRGPLRL
ncbi:anti-sigma factor [Streptomyces thermolineatus]|uniref:anti-sigma factor n=1 Tax=Streptomyces thermolineatus TaxID=44033 RepID=UPI00384CF345